MVSKTTETPWERLTPEERFEKRCAAWLSPQGISFASPEAESNYKARVRRLIKAIQLKKPDMVPVTPFLGDFTAAYCGYTQKDMMYDADKAIDAATRCTLEFDFDAKTAAAAPVGRIYEILGEKQRKWPGHGMSDNGSPQFLEGEYMTADEYDAYILDESDYHWRFHLPRIWASAEPLAKLMPLGSLSSGNIARFALPEVQKALKALMQAGEEAHLWEGKIAAANKKLTEAGYPDLRGANNLGGAPFDRLGDNLRGQRGIALDMYRQPEKLLNAIDMVTEKRLHQIRQSSKTIRPGGSPIVGFALHKGADGFMSDKQFRTFYWPSLRKICLALIEEGFVPELRTQGGYDSRLEVIRDLPKGKAICHLYLTDVEPAQKALGGIMCLVGAVPQSLLELGEPKEIEAYSKRLIDIGGRDGGFMLSSPGALGKGARAENLRAMIRTAKEYGKY